MSILYGYIVANGRFANKITDSNGKETNYSYNFNSVNNNGTGYSNGQVWFDSGINAFDSTRMAGTIVSGDYNGDGKDDIASFYNYCNAQTKIFVWTSTGTSYTMSQIWWASLSGTFDAWRITGMVSSGDYNGDGK